MNLNHLMEFDHVVRVHPDGTVTDAEKGAPWAPEFHDENSQIDGQCHLDGDERWEIFTYGRSGQYGYSGPVMHASEFIGGWLERDILAAPGLYAAVTVYDQGDAEPYGWAVVTIPDE